jgi:hypothetical protein
MILRSSYWCAWAVLLCSSVISVARLPAQQPKTARIEGHVVDVVGASISGALVFVHSRVSHEESLQVTSRTDRMGHFTLVLPEGGYDVLVIAPGFAAAVQTLPAIDGKVRDVQWRLSALGCDIPGVNCDTFR